MTEKKAKPAAKKVPTARAGSTAANKAGTRSQEQGRQSNGEACREEADREEARRQEDRGCNGRTEKSQNSGGGESSSSCCEEEICIDKSCGQQACSSQGD